MLLKASAHCIGRLVKDTLFRIDSNVVSGEHCKIFKAATGRVFLKDTRFLIICIALALAFSCLHSLIYYILVSSNGTFINWMKLGKNSAEAEIHHGDIISFVAAPDSGNIFASFFLKITALFGFSNLCLIYIYIYTYAYIYSIYLYMKFWAPHVLPRMKNGSLLRFDIIHEQMRLKIHV